MEEYELTDSQAQTRWLAKIYQALLFICAALGAIVVILWKKY